MLFCSITATSMPVVMIRWYGFFRARNYRCAGQREAVRGVLTAPGGSTLVVNLPTGSGKSLCAYVPALTDPSGLSVVVVPTTALALDQEAQERARGRRLGMRGPGRPPGRPPGRRAGVQRASFALQNVVAHMRDLEREVAVLRAALARIGELARG